MAAAPDVIESPGGSEPSGKRRLFVVVAAVAAIALLTYLWLRAPSDPRPDTDPPPDAGPLPEQPDAGPLPTGLELGRLLLPTRPPRLLDTADGSSQPITGLPGAGDWTYGMHDLGGGR
ncbi:MAG TPA: hypothetical protein VFX61_22995, partial [Micromonosporaceae bacterium]|nr:hypothetical protein [Micromonosporaceae bacterium]